MDGEEAREQCVPSAMCALAIIEQIRAIARERLVRLSPQQQQLGGAV